MEGDISDHANTSNDISPIPLPPGKLFHVFFSHSSEDDEWVRQMVDRLESEEYGYKCCFADRDFCVGVPVVQNITTSIHTSKRTVIVLSPEFLNSAWCSYEARITMELDIDTRRRLLVPVMLRDCKIPNFIGRLSYINAQNEHFWDRLLEAINASDSERTILDEQSTIRSSSLSPFSFNPNYHNGQHITEISVNEACNCGGNLREGDFTPDELMSRGIEVRQEEYDSVLKIQRRDSLITHHLFFIIKFWFEFFGLALTFTMFLPLVIVHVKPEEVFYIFLFATIIVFALTICMEFYGFIIRCKSAKLATLKEINRILQRRGILAGLYDNGHYACSCRKQIKLKFFYYNWTPCQSYLQDFMITQQVSSGDVEILNETDISLGEENNGATIRNVTQNDNINEQLQSHLNPDELVQVDDSGGEPDREKLVQDEDVPLISDHTVVNIAKSEEALERLLYFSMEYGNLLATKKLNKPETQRHTLKGECLCQFAESLLKDTTGKSSRFQRIFGGLSRRPWARFFRYDT